MRTHNWDGLSFRSIHWQRRIHNSDWFLYFGERNFDPKIKNFYFLKNYGNIVIFLSLSLSLFFFLVSLSLSYLMRYNVQYLFKYNNTNILYDVLYMFIYILHAFKKYTDKYMWLVFDIIWSKNIITQYRLRNQKEFYVRGSKFDQCD